MPLAWLPDADDYPHPWLSWLIQIGFDLAVGALYRKECILPQAVEVPPGALIVSNHQRDSDVPILITALCRRRGVRLLRRLPYFAMREDLFARDALAHLLPRWPRPLARALGLIPLRWFFRAVRTRPLRRVREFTLGETIDAACAAGYAEADPRRVFNARGLRDIAVRVGELPRRVKDIDSKGLGRRVRNYWGLRRLRRCVLRELAPGFRAVVTRQLQGFATLLDEGNALYFAPEGTISPDGRFGRVRNGVRRLVRLAHDPPAFVPVVVSYDALAPGRRLRVVVRVGSPLRDLDCSSQARIESGLRRTLLSLYAVNPSHLVAHFLRHGPRRFATRQFIEWMRRSTAAVADAGLSVDPLLWRMPARELAEERLRWLRRNRLVERDGDCWRSLWKSDATPGCFGPGSIAGFLANSFDDLVALQAPHLARALKP